MLQQLTPDMILVMLMIGVAVFLFVVEWLRVDVVAILMMVSLPLLHLVTPKEAFSGLSSNAVVSIIAVIIIGDGLDRTGIINRLVAPILRLAGKSQSRIVIFISLTVATISSFMQNIGAAALFLPAVQRISKNLKIPISNLLMPIGFSAILGGTVTLVGSSPLILLNDLLIPFKLKPFGLFDVTPVGLALVGSGIACFVIFGRFILPKSKVEEAPPVAEEQAGETDPLFEDLGRLWELKTAKDYTDYRDPITVDVLRRQYLVNVVALTEPPDFKVFNPAPEQEVCSLVDVVVRGQKDDVKRMARLEGMDIKEGLDVFKADLSDDLAGVLEAVVAPRSAMIGRTIEHLDLRRRFGVEP
ncbi:MAG: SLC13 family permease, partial [Proteobacteria bacterium]|nr:SLC13 family permease [Pseudomonadota bacterium]